MSAPKHATKPRRDDTSPAHHGKDMVHTYLVVFGVLVVLTLLTVGTAYLELPHSVAIVVAIVIALAKAALITAFFMHMKGESPLINVSLGVALALVLMLVLLVMPDVGVGPNDEGMCSRHATAPAAAPAHGGAHE